MTTNIVVNLLSKFRFSEDDCAKTLRIVGGLLGHWAVWTRKAVELLGKLHALVEADKPTPIELLTHAQQIDDEFVAEHLDA